MYLLLFSHLFHLLLNDLSRYFHPLTQSETLITSITVPYASPQTLGHLWQHSYNKVNKMADSYTLVIVCCRIMFNTKNKLSSNKKDYTCYAVIAIVISALSSYHRTSIRWSTDINLRLTAHVTLGGLSSKTGGNSIHFQRYSVPNMPSHTYTTHISDLCTIFITSNYDSCHKLDFPKFPETHHITPN